MSKRPQITTGSSVTTPLAETMIKLLGPGITCGSVTLTGDETRALSKLYGFKREPQNERPPKPIRKPDPKGTPPYKTREADEAHKREVAAWEKWRDTSPLLQAGADRNMARYAEADGLRLVAWLAKYVTPGDDPLKTLIQLASDAGFDVSSEDIDYAEESEPR